MIENKTNESKTETEKTTERLKIKEKTKLFKKPFSFTRKAQAVKCEKVKTGERSSKLDTTSSTPPQALPFANISNEELKKMGVIPEPKSHRVAQVILKMPCKALTYLVKNLSKSCASKRKKQTSHTSHRASPELLAYKRKQHVKPVVIKESKTISTKKSFNEKGTQIRTHSRDRSKSSKSVGSSRKPQCSDKSTDTADLNLNIKLTLNKTYNQPIEIKPQEDKVEIKTFRHLMLIGSKFLYDMATYFIHNFTIKSELFAFSYDAISCMKKDQLQSPEGFSTKCKEFSCIPFKERKLSNAKSTENLSQQHQDKDVKSEPIKPITTNTSLDSPLLKSPFEKMMEVTNKNQKVESQPPIKLEVFFGPLTKEEVDALKCAENQNKIPDDSANKGESCCSFEKMLLKKNSGADSLAVMPSTYIYPGPMQFIKNICEKNSLSEIYNKLTKELEDLFNNKKNKTNEEVKQISTEEESKDKSKKVPPATLPKPKSRKRPYIPMSHLTLHQAMLRKLHNDSISPPLIQRLNSKVCENVNSLSLCEPLYSVMKRLPNTIAKLGGGGKPCFVCGNVAYPAERVSLSKGSVHLQCFRCNKCKALLNCGRWNTFENEYYCDPCHRKKALIVFR